MYISLMYSDDDFHSRYYYSHFVDEKSKIQNSEVIFSRIPT